MNDKTTKGELMGVQTQHVDYTYNTVDWKRYRDFTAGSKQVKSQRTLYLPALEGSKNDTEAYTSYLNRTLFYAGTSRSVDGLVGSIFRKKI